MLRLTVRLSDGPEDVRDLALRLRTSTPPYTRIVAAFIEAKTIEAYFDGTDEGAIDELARRLGFDDYEVTEVEPLLADVDGAELEPPLRSAHPATITQVLMEPDGRTIRVQARHRRHEAVRAVDVSENEDDVRISLLVGAPEGDPFGGCVSFALGFSWIRIRLDGPLGEREVIRMGPAPSATPRCDAPKSDVATASAEEVLARLERYAAKVRASTSKFQDLALARASAPQAPTSERRPKVRVSRRPLAAS
jgi:hypothetical protein